jgi:SAM-dependent methyltransferase
LKLPVFSAHILLTILGFILSANLSAQQQEKDTIYTPRVGQPGKDVIWVPTPDELVNKMLELAEVASDDFLIDLGSGDGRTVIGAARLGADALGIEFNHDLVKLSREKAEAEGVSEKAKFIEADIFSCDLSRATVITMFLLPELNLRLRPLLLELKPGTRIVSNTFTMGDWEPDFEVMTKDNWDSWYTALMWIVPSKVDGTWNFSEGSLKIQQEFQMIYGTYSSGNKTVRLSEGRLNGYLITFSINGEYYTGRVNGKTMQGTISKGSIEKDWIATRVE